LHALEASGAGGDTGVGERLALKEWVGVFPRLARRFSRTSCTLTPYMGANVQLVQRDRSNSPPQCRRSTAALGVDVELYDERFTTALAQQRPGLAAEDSRAAAVLLEDWLAARR
jgi:hypothetical protein